MDKQVSKLNYLKIAPRKVRLVAGLVRGLPVSEAEAQLMAERRRPAKSLLKLLRSAVANAKNNAGLNPDKLFIEKIAVDQGPMLKRQLPRARGTATLIQKKMSHITLVLAENPKLEKSKYKIVVPKKVKLPPSDTTKKDKKSKKKPEGEITSSARPKKSGLFKKVFSRKSGMGN